MPVTMRTVRAWLDAEEVEYVKAKRMGAAAVPFLMELAQGGDLALASKATYLASLIDSEQSAAVLETAAARNEPVLKVAAASGMRNLPDEKAERILELLKNDPDAGVRKVLVKSADRFKSARMANRVQQMADSDPEPFVREMAASAVTRMRKRAK